MICNHPLTKICFDEPCDDRENVLTMVKWTNMGILLAHLVKLYFQKIEIKRLHIFICGKLFYNEESLLLTIETFCPTNINY